ncbi:MAG: hypothetical protein H7A46_17005 [Verrucomicrobiales bacterium]|nr:hypothetical protein [Verrucomicrobiales bacterium]
MTKRIKNTSIRNRTTNQPASNAAPSNPVKPALGSEEGASVVLPLITVLLWPVLLARVPYPMPEGAVAYTKLYLSHLEALRSKLRRRGLAYDQADPLAAEILDSVLKYTPFSHPRFDSRLKRRTRGRLASYFRKSWVKRGESLTAGVLASFVESPADGGVVDLVHDVRWGVSGLSPEAQIVARMLFQDGCSQEEVAEVLGKTVSAVKSLSHRTRRLLRRRLAHRWYRGRWWPAG